MAATLDGTYEQRTDESDRQAARRLSARRARRELTTRLADRREGVRVATAMIGVLGLVVLAGAAFQAVAG
ncbi:hypothetical protein CKO21_09880 [Rhodovibrio salinarum]|uniref:Uncharacterized protein n=1 Tax=Rhodovibrio salinarum TaxID=1087 RepID=A0A934QIS9_9PROT|nr:hypothetical protein [Rhodovibrio salinarum]